MSPVHETVIPLADRVPYQDREVVDSKPPPPSEIDWVLLLARLKYYAFTIGSRVLIFVIYVTMIRDGLVSLFDAFSIRLAKLPFLGFLGWFEMTARVDLALATSVGVFCAVSFSSHHAIRMWAIGDQSELFSGAPELSHRREILIYSLAGIMMFVDVSLMYLSIAESDWGSDGGVSGSAILMSILYTGMLVFLAVMTIQLKFQLAAAEAAASNR